MDGIVKRAVMDVIHSSGWMGKAIERKWRLFTLVDGGDSQESVNGGYAI